MSNRQSRHRPTNSRRGGHCLEELESRVLLSSTNFAGAHLGVVKGLARSGAFGALYAATGRSGSSLAPALAPTPPANDDFANRIVLTGATISTTGTNVLATKQGGEPNHAGNVGGASAWWSWTATSSGKVQIDTTGSDYDTLLGVYTGNSLGSLNVVASNDDTSFGSSSLVKFNAVSGTAYRIAVDGYNDELGAGPATGNITLHVLSVIPANDNFANRITINGTSANVTGSNVLAGKETNEPLHAGNTGGASVWWKWTAPSNTQVELNTAGSSFDTVLAVYTGTSVSALTPVVSNDNGGGNFTSRVVFAATQGVTYQIAVDGAFDGVSADEGSITIKLRTVAPANDNFSDRVTISGNDATLATNNEVASKEVNEPNHGEPDGLPRGGASLWWTWTAVKDGIVEVNTTGSGIDTVMAAYTGTSIATLNLVEENDDNPDSNDLTSKVRFVVAAGTTYQFAVDGFQAMTGAITLHLHFQLAGDGNNNGVVDAGDFDTWFAHVGQSTSQGAPAGDYDESGIVDATDFDVWFQHVGLHL